MTTRAGLHDNLESDSEIDLAAHNASHPPPRGSRPRSGNWKGLTLGIERSDSAASDAQYFLFLSAGCVAVGIYFPNCKYAESDSVAHLCESHAILPSHCPGDPFEVRRDKCPLAPVAGPGCDWGIHAFVGLHEVLGNLGVIRRLPLQ